MKCEKNKNSLEKLKYLGRSSIKNKIVIEVYFPTNKSLEPDSLGCFLRKWGSEWLGFSALAPGCVTLGHLDSEKLRSRPWRDTSHAQ